jgi:endonuclease III
MKQRSSKLAQIVKKLEALYGPPSPPAFRDSLEMILFENVAYLVSDAKREVAFQTLRNQIGTQPTDILSASRQALLEVAKLGGMLPENRVEKLLDIAQLTMQEFGGDLDSALKQTESRAKRSLMKFPGIGEPSAERILLYTKTFPMLGLDSNGLRVPTRIGYGREYKNYSTMYHSVRDAIKEELKPDYDWLIKANQLLTLHGKTLCRRSQPRCEACPLTSICGFLVEGSRIGTVL